MNAFPATVDHTVDTDDLTLRVHGVSGDAWDRFVNEARHASFCHLWGWRAILEGLYGFDAAYAAAVDATGAIRAVLPLARIQNALFGQHLVSVPLLNYGGPVGEPAGAELLARWALTEGRRSGADTIQLRSRHDVADDLPISRHKVTVVLDLPDSADTLWNDVFRSKLRSQIRRPKKEGMTARFGTDQVDAFYTVFSQNMRDLGVPVHPRELFEAIRATFPEQVEFGVVYSDDTPVAAGCGFVWREEFEMTWASSLREYNRQAPNMLLYWAFMERMIERGVRRFNFGRSTPGEGTHRFKRQWGGRDEELPWIHWSREESDPTAPQERRGMGIAQNVWRRLPVWLSNRVGPPVAKRLPWW